MWGNDVWGEWGEFSPDLVLDDAVWDVFELDDETAEPEPQYGDFWWQPEEEERI